MVVDSQNTVFLRTQEPRAAKDGACNPGLLRSQENEGGFTLVEMMVVLFIIGLLSAIVIINVLPNQDKAMVTKAKTDIATMGQAMEMYRLDNLRYPGTGDGLAALTQPPASLTQPERYRPGGYIKQLPADPWGNPYQFASPGRNGAPFEIYSLGADGAPGGSDLDADIYDGQ